MRSKRQSNAGQPCVCEDRHGISHETKTSWPQNAPINIRVFPDHRKQKQNVGFDFNLTDIDVFGQGLVYVETGDFFSRKMSKATPM